MCWGRYCSCFAVLPVLLQPLAQVRSISGVVVVQRQPLVCAAAHPPQSQCEGMGACLGLNEQRQLLACAAAHPLLSLCQGMGACLGLNVQQLPFACAAAHPLLSLFEKVGGCLGLVSHSFPDLCEGVGGRLGLRADGCLPGLIHVCPLLLVPWAAFDPGYCCRRFCPRQHERLSRRPGIHLLLKGMARA